MLAMILCAMMCFLWIFSKSDCQIWQTCQVGHSQPTQYTVAYLYGLRTEKEPIRFKDWDKQQLSPIAHCKLTMWCEVLPYWAILANMLIWPECHIAITVSHQYINSGGFASTYSLPWSCFWISDLYYSRFHTIWMSNTELAEYPGWPR